ncbi:protein of unknown function [Serratia sp. Tan611]|nr:protein of unknown function [Serratia sp. Tan611]
MRENKKEGEIVAQSRKKTGPVVTGPVKVNRVGWRFPMLATPSALPH